MTREEFIAGWCRRSDMTWEEVQAEGWDAFPCHCGEDGCQGWQMYERGLMALRIKHGLERPLNENAAAKEE